MSIFIFLFRHQNTLMLVFLSIVIYGITLFTFKTFSNDELAVFRELLKKRTVKLAVNSK